MSKRFKPKRSYVENEIPFLFQGKQLHNRSVTSPRGTYNASDFTSRIGQWVEFKTRWGTHRGMIEEVNGDAVLMKMPRSFASTRLVHDLKSTTRDIQLAGCDGFDGCHPIARRGPWCWFWFPIIIIIFIFPWFCW